MKHTLEKLKIISRSRIFPQFIGVCYDYEIEIPFVRIAVRYAYYLFVLFWFPLKSDIETTQFHTSMFQFWRFFFVIGF